MEEDQQVHSQWVHKDVSEHDLEAIETGVGDELPLEELRDVGRITCDVGERGGGVNV